MRKISHGGIGRACGAALALAVAVVPAASGQQQTPTVGSPPPVGAAPAPPAIDRASETDTVYIFGRAIRLAGEAQSASEGIVGFADFDLRPLSRPGELVEVIPGMIATQHSGGGKANQYFLRGFNLDHGTDFAGFLDGVPLNLRSHAHMNGYLDINFMIPEIVRTVEFHKGVHYADVGDFSAAGSAKFETYDALPSSFAQLDITDDGEFRVLAAGSRSAGASGTILGALQYEGGDGPFERAEELDKYSGYLKYTGDLGAAKLRVALLGYRNSWFATDQIPARAVEQGLISRFGTLDPNLGGETHRYFASASVSWEKAGVQAYAQDYSLDLYGNPTFFLDQIEGDEFKQVDRRKSVGARGHIERDFALLGVATTGRLGADVHADFVDPVALVKTRDRIETGDIRRDQADVVLADIWGDMTLHWTSRLRTTLGLRGDHVAFDVKALQAENSGEGSDTQWSPKSSIAYRFSEALEAYAAYGYGFHTNDPRGAVLTRDPLTGDPVTPVTLFAESKGGEIGLRYEPSTEFNLSASAFSLDLDSELIFVGDAGTSEPSGATRRSGVELAAFWRPIPALAFDAQAAWSRARFRDVPDAEDNVPNSVEFVAGAGATVILADGWNGSLRLRHLGEAALIEDGSQVSDPTTIVNLGVGKVFDRVEIGLDVLNLLDSDENDITYFYESQLLGEPAPVADIHFHPVHPRSVRLILKTKF